MQQEVLAGGRVEALGEFNAVLRFGMPVNHVLHLILTMVTLGLWVVVWIRAASTNARTNFAVALNVNESGSLVRQATNAR